MTPEQIKEQIEAIKSHTNRILKQPKEWQKQYFKYITGESETCPEFETEQPSHIPRSHVKQVIEKWIDSPPWTKEVQEKIISEICEPSHISGQGREAELEKCLGEAVRNFNNPIAFEVFGHEWHEKAKQLLNK